MKLLNKALFSVLLGSVMTMSAQAAVSYTNGQAYVGAKVGQYDPEVDNDSADNDATSYGVYAGYNITPEFSVEAEYLGTTAEDAYNDSFEKLEYDASVFGLYGTYHYTFPNTGLYAKGRLGVAKHEVDFDYTDKEDSFFDESFSISDTGIAGGLGLGYNITPMVGVEAMYNMYPTIDVDGVDYDASGITLGAHVKF